MEMQVWDIEPPSRDGEWALNFRDDPNGCFEPVTGYPWGQPLDMDHGHWVISYDGYDEYDENVEYDE